MKRGRRSLVLIVGVLVLVMLSFMVVGIWWLLHLPRVTHIIIQHVLMGGLGIFYLSYYVQRLRLERRGEAVFGRVAFPFINRLLMLGGALLTLGGVLTPYWVDFTIAGTFGCALGSMVHFDKKPDVPGC